MQACRQGYPPNFVFVHPVWKTEGLYKRAKYDGDGDGRRWLRRRVIRVIRVCRVMATGHIAASGTASCFLLPGWLGGSVSRFLGFHHHHITIIIIPYFRIPHNLSAVSSASQPLGPAQSVSAFLLSPLATLLDSVKYKNIDI